MQKEELTLLLRGSIEQNERRKRWLALIHRIPRRYSLNHAEEYEESSQKSAIFINFIRMYRISDLDEQENLSEALGDVLPIDMHRKMFIPALQLSMDPEQLQVWLPLALNYEILGAYAQTELGHGSNVQGIETVATFNPETLTFDLHSPSVTSRKWWPGALAKTANFAMVYARLCVSNIDYGVHAFIVQLRDLKSHSTLPGVTLGDIGPKLGFNGVDNGFCVFNHVQVPQENLCLLTARVQWDTRRKELIPRNKPHDKWNYFTMVKTRVFLISKCARFLARATGYTMRNTVSNCRQQLLPWIGLSFAAHIAGRNILGLYDSVLRDRSSKELSELHATSSGLKALVSILVARGIDICKYQLPKDPNLDHWWRGIVGAVTYEGTFDVLQHAKYLTKVECDVNNDIPSRELWDDLSTLVEWFRFRWKMLHSNHLSTMFSMTRLSVAHSEWFLLKEFTDAIRRIQDLDTRDALTNVGKQLAYMWIRDSLHEFRQSNHMTSCDAEKILHLFETPSTLNASLLCDSWDFTREEIPFSFHSNL